MNHFDPTDFKNHPLFKRLVHIIRDIAPHFAELKQKIENSDELQHIIDDITLFGKSILISHQNLSKDRHEYNPSLIHTLSPLQEFLFQDYFAVSIYGHQNIPQTGPAIFIANHSGTLPYDASMLHMAFKNHSKDFNNLRFLTHEFAFKLPYIGNILSQLGCVIASPENAISLLERNHFLVTYPEGLRGIGKPYDERYTLQHFGNHGFIKLALLTNAPIIPIAIIGAEEIHPLIWQSKWLAKFANVPFIPFTSTFPWLGPLGALPLPSKWHIQFGRPIDLRQKYKLKHALCNQTIAIISNQIHKKLQLMIQRRLAKRTSIWS